VATETDAARDRVLAARASLGEELETLEASARSAIDIPAKIKRSPAKAAAVVGGTAFLALGGPRRVFRAGKRAVTGEPEPLPPSMLPKEIDKSCGPRRRRQEGTRRARARFRGLRQAGAKDDPDCGRSSCCPSPGRSWPVPPRLPRPIVQPRRGRFPDATDQIRERAKRQSGGEGESTPSRRGVGRASWTAADVTRQKADKRLREGLG
jgi:hypothetical protein